MNVVTEDNRLFVAALVARRVVPFNTEKARGYDYDDFLQEAWIALAGRMGKPIGSSVQWCARDLNRSISGARNQNHWRVGLMQSYPEWPDGDYSHYIPSLTANPLSSLDFDQTLRELAALVASEICKSGQESYRRSVVCILWDIVATDPSANRNRALSNSLDALAEGLGISMSHLHNLFSRIRGILRDVALDAFPEHAALIHRLQDGR